MHGMNEVKSTTRGMPKVIHVIRIRESSQVWYNHYLWYNADPEQKRASACDASMQILNRAVSKAVHKAWRASFDLEQVQM